MRYGCLVIFIAVRAAVTMRSRTLEEHNRQDLGRTHHAARAAMQLLCDCCSVQSSTGAGTPGWDSSSWRRRPGMTEANQSKGGGHASTQAHEIPEPGTLGKRGFFWALSRFYAWTASTPGWRAAEKRVCMCPCFPHSPMRRRRPCCLVPTGIAPETCCRGVSTSAPVRSRVCCAPQHLFSCSVLFSSSARLSNVERARSQVQTGPHTTLATTAAASH